LTDELNQTSTDNEVYHDDTADVSDEEIALLQQTDRPVTDETKDLQKLKLDEDNEDNQLNEGGDPLDLGDDLDLPGTELDDENESMGEEDEENNHIVFPIKKARTRTTRIRWIFTDFICENPLYLLCQLSIAYCQLPIAHCLVSPVYS